MARKIVTPVEVQASVTGDQSVKSFRTQLKEAQQEAFRLAQALGQTAPEAVKAAQKVAELKDQMDDFNATVAGIHPDRFQAVANVTGTLANGFAAAQGAAALLGTESEDLQKQMAKVQGAMAFSQGIAGLKDIEFQFNSVSKMVTSTVVPAFNAMRAALGTAGLIGVFIAVGAAITYIISNWKELTGQLNDTERAQRRVMDTMRQATAGVEDQRMKVEFYRKIINDATKSEDERRAALEKLKELVPTLADNEIDNANALAQTNTELNDYIKNAILRAQIDALIAKRAENNNKIAEATAQGLDNAATFSDKAKAAFQSFATGVSYDGLVAANAANSLGKSIADLNTENEQLDKQLEELESQYIKTEVQQDKYKKKVEESKKATKGKTQAVKEDFQVLEETSRKEIQLVEETTKQKKARLKEFADFAQKTAIDQDKLQAAIDKVEQERNKKRLEEEKAFQENKRQLAIDSTLAVINLLDAITANSNAKTEEQRKKEFERQKAFQIASTVVSTYAAAQKAYQSQMQFTPDSPIRATIAAAIAVASGLARVAAIKKQQFNASAPGGMQQPGNGGMGGLPQPSFTSSTLGGGTQFAGSFDNKVYVTEGDITGTQRRVRQNRGVSVI